MDDEVNAQLERANTLSVGHLQLDVLHCTLSVRLYGIDQVPVHHVIEFYGVVSLFYAAGEGPLRLLGAHPTEELDWRIAWHRSAGIARIQASSSTDVWANSFYAIPNFAMELGGDGALFVEASNVSVDGTNFDVGFAESPVSS